MRRCAEALQLAKKVGDEAAAGNSAGQKDELGVMHLESVFPFQSDQQNALLFIAAAAVHTRDKTKEERTGTLFTSCAFYFYATTLLEKPKAVQKTAIPAPMSTLEEFLCAQMPQTKGFLLFVKTMFLDNMSLLSHDTSHKGRILAARAKACSQLSAGVVCRHSFPPQDMVVPEKKQTEAFRQ